MGFGAQGSGFRVQGLELQVLSLGFRFRVKGLRLGLRV
jgi:hypothetical protein